MKTTTKVNQLIHRIEKTKGGKDYIIKIKLADECRNGHNDFSITGEVYPTGKRGDRNCERAGAIGDTIAKVFPELAIFNDLHLANVKGVPMYAIANGFYHLKETGIDVARKYLRVTEDEIKTLATAEDELYFTYLLNKLGIPARWEKEANKAIKMLEQMTGEHFEDDSKKLEKIALSPSKKLLIETRIKEGYYTPATIEARRLKAIEDAKQKALKEIEDDFNKSVEKERNEYLVKRAVLLAGLSNDNIIYYPHTNEVVFNWNTSSYNKAITPAEFDGFMDWIKLEKPELPKGILFKIKD